MIIGSSVRSLGADNSSEQRQRERERERERGGGGKIVCMVYGEVGDVRLSVVRGIRCCVDLLSS